jgi:RNA polymerase sigma-70 factor (ECF subfamily)
LEAVDARRDEELLADHLAGKKGAFDILVQRYADELFAFLHRFVGNAAAADDLVQESFLQVHLAADAFDPQRAFRPWLYTIAANKARDYLRGRGRRLEQSLDARGPDDDGLGPDELVPAAEESSFERSSAEEVRAAVRSVIAKMPEHLQLILMLGYFQRLPYSDIAEILDIPVGTVKSRLHAAVARFAWMWHKQMRPERQR